MGLNPQDRQPTAYLHSCDARSTAWPMPLSENVSVVWVPREVVALITRSAPLRMVSSSLASSAAFLTQAPSFWVYIGKFAPPTATLASEFGLNPLPVTRTETSLFTFSAGRVEMNM